MSQGLGWLAQTLPNSPKKHGRAHAWPSHGRRARHAKLHSKPGLPSFLGLRSFTCDCWRLMFDQFEFRFWDWWVRDLGPPSRSGGQPEHPHLTPRELLRTGRQVSDDQVCNHRSKPLAQTEALHSHHFRKQDPARDETPALRNATGRTPPPCEPEEPESAHSTRGFRLWGCGSKAHAQGE